MADATANRIGQDLGTGAVDALFEQLYLTELHAAFLEANIMRPLTMVKSISHGKSASFPKTWKTAAQYHVAGTEIVGTNNVQHTEKIISVDERVESDIFVNEIDELKNHYGVRGEYSRQMGHALAEKLDVNILRSIILAARATPDFGAADTTTPTDRVLENANAATDADTLIKLIWDAAETFDVGNVPKDGRALVLGPAQFYLLFQSTGNYMLNRDWGGGGSIQTADLPPLAGFSIHKSNHMNSTSLGDNYAGVTGENNTYSGDFRNTVATAFHKSAVGTVMLKDLAFRAVEQPEKFGTLLIGSYISGTSDLRPESAIEIATAEV